MKVSDAQLDEVRERGFTIVPGLLDPRLLVEAQDALWSIFPRPETDFADPQRYPQFAKSQFSGLRNFPCANWALDRLAVLPDLVDAATRFCASDDLQLYKIELWAKYSGAIDYTQPQHRDYGNHTLVVPKASSPHAQMTTFILLSDVTPDDGPTRILPLERSRNIPLIPRELPMGACFEHDVAVTGSAGSLVIYKTDVLHRGSNFRAPGRSRFSMLVDFQPRGWPWAGKMAWPNHALAPGWSDAMVRMTPRERALFGFPKPGDDYWDAQTIRDVGLRYPGMDMGTYASP